MNFTKPTDIRKKRLPKADPLKVAALMDVFNKHVKRKGDRYDTYVKDGEDYVGVYAVNNAINKHGGFDILSESEVKLATRLAKKDGWELTVKSDNYQTKSYYFKPIIKSTTSK